MKSSSGFVFSLSSRCRDLKSVSVSSSTSPISEKSPEITPSQRETSSSGDTLTSSSSFSSAEKKQSRDDGVNGRTAFSRLFREKIVDMRGIGGDLAETSPAIMALHSDSSTSGDAWTSLSSFSGAENKQNRDDRANGSPAFSGLVMKRIANMRGIGGEMAEISPSITPLYSDSSTSGAEKKQNRDDGENGSSSFSSLIRDQIGNVRGIGGLMPETKETNEFPARNRRHRRSRSEGKVDNSVEIVKETLNPLNDFRTSMLQMIIENEIVEREELQDLLIRFLCINRSTHHGLIFLAFSEIWAEVFSGYQDTPACRPLSRRTRNRSS